ncbi:MAG: class I SAM-dependent methyltransferase [Desulfohalobiaceae bacterium]
MMRSPPFFAKRRTQAGTNDEYGRLARIYDPVTAPFLDPIRRSVAQRAEKAGCRNVLDVCCGTGRQCLFLHRSGIQTTGVDLSPAMLSVARKKSPAAVAYSLQDAAHMGFADNSFHGAVICLALHEKPREVQKAMLRETARVLVPGGSLFLVDFVVPHGLAGRAMRLVLAGVERIAGREHYANFRAYTDMGSMARLRAEMPFVAEGLGSRFLAGNVELAVFMPCL